MVIPTRSYIFLLKQPCWDGKFHADDSFPNLGIKPCCKILIMPEIKIIAEKDNLKIEIKKEGDIIAYTWQK